MSLEERMRPAPAVGAFARAVEGLVAGLYVGGSLATRDYRPGISDIDAVALVERTLSTSTRRSVVLVHEQLVREVVDGGALHCVYVPRRDVGDLSRKHWTWAFGEMFRRPFGGIARAELLVDPLAIFGPPPSMWLPPMDVEELRDAARAELAGYWSRAVRKRSIWLQDVYVDISLTVLARADATIREGRLITKSEAISRLGDLGVPHDIVVGVKSRRDGTAAALNDAQRLERAVEVRQLMRDGMARLLP